MTQAASSPPVDPVWRAMSADTMKIPEPIIDPTTIIVESKRPRPRTNPDDSVSAATPVIAGDLTSHIPPLLTLPGSHSPPPSHPPPTGPPPPPSPPPPPPTHTTP